MLDDLISSDDPRDCSVEWSLASNLLPFGLYSLFMIYSLFMAGCYPLQVLQGSFSQRVNRFCECCVSMDLFNASFFPGDIVKFAA